VLKRKRHAADEKVLDRRTERHDKAPLLKSAETDAVHAEKLQLLVAFSVIICGYGECDFKTNALDVFEEEDAPLNAWDHTLSHETALHLAASLSYALAADAECIVFALILLERLGRDVLRALLAPGKWRNTVITAFSLAAKMWHDESTWLADIQLSLQRFGYRSRQLCRQEVCFFALIGHNAFVSVSTYESYLKPMIDVFKSDEGTELFSRIEELADAPTDDIA